MSKVSIQIVAWNSLKFLPDCLGSIFQQTYKDFSVLVIDNASNDGTIEFLREKYPQVFVVQNTRNLGFCGGHNQGFKLTQQSPYVLVMNPDIILEPDFLEKTIIAMEKDSKIGAVGGKLLRIQIGDPEIEEKIKTKFIDSTGMVIKKTREVINRGEGEIDRGQYNQAEKVFGISGACVLYRRAALEDVKITKCDPNTRIHPNNNSGGRVRVSRVRQLTDERALFGCEYFDEDFFAYKEDIDLAWRMKHRGWYSLYLPDAVVYHFRQTQAKKGVWQTILNRRQKSKLINYLSYRNHFFVLVKNEQFKDFFRHFPYIFWYEFKKIIYILLFEQSTLKGLIDAIRKSPKMMRKRKAILKPKLIETCRN